MVINALVSESPTLAGYHIINSEHVVGDLHLCFCAHLATLTQASCMPPGPSVLGSSFEYTDCRVPATAQPSASNPNYAKFTAGPWVDLSVFDNDNHYSYYLILSFVKVESRDSGAGTWRPLNIVEDTEPTAQARRDVLRDVLLV